MEEFANIVLHYASSLCGGSSKKSKSITVIDDLDIDFRMEWSCEHMPHDFSKDFYMRWVPFMLLSIHYYSLTTAEIITTGFKNNQNFLFS